MLVRLRALDVVPGGASTGVVEGPQGGEARKATRLAAVHVASESGIPADVTLWRVKGWRPDFLSPLTKSTSF